MSTVINAIITGIFAIIAAIAGSIATLLYQDYRNRIDLTRLTYGKKVAIRVSDGTYLQVSDDGETLMGGNKEITKAWSHFTIIKANSPSAKTIKDGDVVAFKVKLKGDWRFVSTRDDEQKQLKAQPTHLEDWGKFKICTTPKSESGVFHYDSPFALKALVNDRIVAYNPQRDNGRRRLLAVHDKIEKPDTFVFVNPYEKSDD